MSRYRRTAVTVQTCSLTHQSTPVEL